jgi:mono/diheme cytochrome c family protein
MRTRLLAIALAVLLAPAASPAQDGAALFTDNCAPCHNIGEDGGAGPDLRGIAARRQRAWLVAYVLDPASLKRDAEMPAADLSREAIAAILDYIDSRSGGAPAPPAPAAPTPVFSPADVSRGLDLFAGRARLANGGPACLACHDAGVGGGLGGGTLGPDLARIATRLSGPKGTAAWLSSPPTPVMRSVYDRKPIASAEVHALTAFFVDRVRPDAPPVPVRTRRFIALGVAGAAAAFLLIGAAWRGRLQPVRRGLVVGAARHSAGAAAHTHGFRSGGPR